jgi:hypothetical protein
VKTVGQGELAAMGLSTLARKVLAVALAR